MTKLTRAIYSNPVIIDAIRKANTLNINGGVEDIHYTVYHNPDTGRTWVLSREELSPAGAVAVYDTEEGEYIE